MGDVNLPWRLTNIAKGRPEWVIDLEKTIISPREKVDKKNEWLKTRIITFEDRPIELEAFQEEVANSLSELKENTKDIMVSLWSELANVRIDKDMLTILWEELNQVQGQVNLLIKVANNPSHLMVKISWIRASKPKIYESTWYVKEMENYLFNLEWYFWLVNIDLEKSKVTIASMYPVSDIKLWLWTKMEEIIGSWCEMNS